MLLLKALRPLGPAALRRCPALLEALAAAVSSAETTRTLGSGAVLLQQVNLRLLFFFFFLCFFVFVLVFYCFRCFMVVFLFFFNSMGF